MTELAVADPMLPVPYRLQRFRRELSDVFTVDLQSSAGSHDFQFTAGQFNMLYAFGIGEVPISISGDPAEPATLVHTIRSVGPVTRALEKLRRGDTIGVRGPYGVGWPVTQAEGSDIVIVTGGLGLAPLRPAIYQILANRSQYGNICIFYGARTPNDILFSRQLHEWRGRFDLSVDVIVDRAQRDWNGKVGVVIRLLEHGGFDPLHSIALVCGPEIMMRFAVQALNQQGVDDDAIYVSMERNMKCAVGFCGHCQFGPGFVCKDGPVYRFDQISHLFGIREL